jgi:HAD superfamily hydrolase (TIGR01549 family)
VGELNRPEALLLDFGGVVVTTTRRPTWSADLAGEIHDRLVASGCTALSVEQVRIDIESGAIADAHWKNAMSRPREPRELTHREFWADFVAADWPPAALAWVTAEATALCRRKGELRQDRTNRSGIHELLDAAAAIGVPVGIVSNALSGAVHRDHMERHGLDKRVAVQVYSDEVGIRKPHPGMITMAAAALGVPVERTWYVGDNYDRDVLCGRRAGVGAAVLMTAAGTEDRPFPVSAEPDAVVADPAALRELLLAACAVEPMGDRRGAP